MQPKYSFIVPLYNEEDTLHEMYRRVRAVADRMDGTVELILVNDGSRDRSLQIIQKLHRQDPSVCYLSFARNFGHQIAVTAGLHFARGEAVVILDADLQDPPELIPDMVEQWRQGYQVVYARRIKRHRESWFKRLTAYIFYRLLNSVAEINIPTDTGDFCLMDRQVVDLLNAMPEQNRYIRGLRSWIGFRQIAIPFERDHRFAGDVKYTFYKSFGLAINSLISFSKVPLRISTYLGLLAAAFAIFMSVLVLYWRLTATNSPLTGFATIAIAVFFLASVQLICIGILGEYVGRIYEEVKARPLYTLAEVGGFSKELSPTKYKVW